MPRFCASCGAQMADTACVCPSCGKAAGQSAGGGAAAAPAAAPVVAASGGGLADNVAGGLCYLTIIPAIIFLVIEPYNKNKFVRFHAFQNLFFAAAWVVAYIGMMVLSFALAFVPMVGWIIALLLWLAIGLGGFISWILMIIKAFQGSKFKMPIIGNLAEKQAG